MVRRKGFSKAVAEFELKYILIGILIGLGLGYLQWKKGMDIVATIMALIPM